MQVKKMFLIVLGCIGLALGAVGAIVPLLPAFPFLMLAAFCFAKSSERLDTWFRSTKLYKENLASYVKGEGMHISAKKRVVCMISALMAIGFIIMLTKQVYIGCMILFVVWVFHIIYFAYGVKTKAEEQN